MQKLSTPYLTLVLILLVLGLIAFTTYQYLTQPQIAYVRSYDLIEKYQGTIEAKVDFNKKKNDLTANVDSLKFDFEREKQKYFQEGKSLSPQQRMAREEYLNAQHARVMQYSEVADQKIQDEDKAMMQTVLNQVNSFVEEYAKEKGYDVILGTTLSGSLLYGDKSLDVTDALLVELNNHYKGK